MRSKQAVGEHDALAAPAHRRQGDAATPPESRPWSIATTLYPESGRKAIKSGRREKLRTGEMENGEPVNETPRGIIGSAFFHSRFSISLWKRCVFLVNPTDRVLGTAHAGLPSSGSARGDEYPPRPQRYAGRRDRAWRASPATRSTTGWRCGWSEIGPRAEDAAHPPGSCPSMTCRIKRTRSAPAPKTLRRRRAHRV